MSGNMFTLPFRINTLAPFPYLQGSKTVVLKEGEANDRDQKKLQAERVILTVECFPKFPIDHVHCDIGTEEKNHLTRERDTWESSHFPTRFLGSPATLSWDLPNQELVHWPKGDKAKCVCNFS